MLSSNRSRLIAPAIIAALLGFFAADAFAQNQGGTVRRGTTASPHQRPNIVVIWGGDVGRSNLSTYFSDDGDLLALRHGNWKMHFKVQDQPGTLELWQREFRNLRLPYLFNLRTDPYERATITSNDYWNWYIRHVFLLVPAQQKVGEFLATFKEYPPRQKAASFTIDQILQTLQDAHGKSIRDVTGRALRAFRRAHPVYCSPRVSISNSRHHEPDSTPNSVPIEVS